VAHKPEADELTIPVVDAGSGSLGAGNSNSGLLKDTWQAEFHGSRCPIVGLSGSCLMVGYPEIDSLPNLADWTLKWNTQLPPCASGFHSRVAFERGLRGSLG